MARQLGVAVGSGRKQAGAEGKAESCTGAHVGHTRVRNHWAVAITATPTSCFTLEVQRQCPAAPRLSNLGLHLGEIDGWQSGVPLTLHHVPLPASLHASIPALNDRRLLEKPTVNLSPIPRIQKRTQPESRSSNGPKMAEPLD